MFMIHVCSFAILASRFLLCQTANVPPNDGSLLDLPAPLINGTTTASPSNDIQIQCGARQFGTNLDYDSCLDALHTFTKGDSPVPVEIGRRNTGAYSHTLPWKWVSGNGRCIFDIVMKGPTPSETTTGQEIARAALRLVNECVRGQGKQGGVVSGIADNTFPLLPKGQEGKLAIFMRSYDPSYIECGSTTQRYTADDKCAELLSTIPAEISPTISWGPTGKHLPYLWQLQGKACRLMLWGAYGRQELSDTISAYEIWTAGVMLAGKCARFNKPGKYPHLGRNGRLWVFLDDGRSVGMDQPSDIVGNETEARDATS
ncbi:MAG: hypothetical protein L6R38_008776 [Xanthoria sp. 2 TBL-2021]|nr:MAG: hypothetical protein L6R38_008776 [Xanthoria sp. 2 TBL-2021]